MEAGLEPALAEGGTVRRKVLQIKHEREKAACVVKEGGRVLVSNFLALQIRPGDEIDFPLIAASPEAGTEIYIHKNTSSPRTRDVYQVSIGYAAQPKSDKREQLYVRAEIPHGNLGISALHFPCEVLRDYFYVANRNQPWDRQNTLYETLRIPSTTSPAELRLAFKLRELELRAEGAPKAGFFAMERAFNILAQPELRACYDELMCNSVAPVLFPYGGFGSIIVAGDRSRDGQTFFVARVLSFLPERRQRRFRASLRQADFYADRAIYRDSRRKLEVLLDQSTMPILWDATWNQWKHLLAAKMEIQATFVEAGKYLHRRGEWHLVKWETALPSRLQVKLPPKVAEEIESARRVYHRFGQFSDAFDRIRARIEREPVEKTELQKLCWDLGVPSDFEIAQITWKPDYDAFYYRHLCRCARRLYLFRGEYIFELETVIAVETPQSGHATYLFSKAKSMEDFLAAYIRVTKEDIRKNRNNLAETLGFLGRVVHGVNGRLWLRELKSRTGEPVDYGEVTPTIKP